MTDATETLLPRRHVLRMMVERGERLTLLEALGYIANRYFARPLGDFAWKVRVTPALRERCVAHLVKAGASSDVWRLKSDAQDLAEFIARGER